MTRGRQLMLAMVLLASAAGPAMAQGRSAGSNPSAAKKTLLFLGGAAAGLGIHESGHLIFAAAFGAHPSVDPIRFGGIPFFAIGHDAVTRRREFVISSAGLWMQAGSAEWVLTRHPRLRDENAPALKGLLAFHLVTSGIYATAAFGRIGPAERDTLGLAESLGRDGVPEPVVGILVLAPAALDAYRYLRPGSGWAKWASRGTKVLAVVLTAVAGR
jgi:hypothetical protein